jgi:hypothetical protein
MFSIVFGGGLCNEAVTVETIWREVVGELVSDALKGIWKEVIVASSRYSLGIYLEELRKSTKTLSQDNRCPSRS